MRTLVFWLLWLVLVTPAAADSDYEYKLDFELNPRTGTYGPAYTYAAKRGTSTIWLDGANAKTHRQADRAALLVKFASPKGWKTAKDASRARVHHKDGTAFTIFASRAGKAEAADFAAEWKSRARRAYGALDAQDVKRVAGEGVVVQMSARPSGTGVGVLAVIYKDRRALPVMLEFPDRASFERHQAALERFLASIELLEGQLTE